MVLIVQLWDVGNETLRSEDVSGLWKLTVLTSVVSAFYGFLHVSGVRNDLFLASLGSRLTTTVGRVSLFPWPQVAKEPTQPALFQLSFAAPVPITRCFFATAVPRSRVGHRRCVECR